MEILGSVIANLALKMKGIVIQTMIVNKVLYAGQTTAQIIKASIMGLIAVMFLFKRTVQNKECLDLDPKISAGKMKLVIIYCIIMPYQLIPIILILKKRDFNIHNKIILISIMTCLVKQLLNDALIHSE